MIEAALCREICFRVEPLIPFGRGELFHEKLTK